MKNKTDIVYRPAINNKRVESAVTIEIKSKPHKIFALACPVEELRWIPDWQYELVYSKSGINETGCIFNEEKLGFHFFERSLTTTWVTNVYNPERYHLQFQLSFSGKAIIQFNIRIREVGKDISSCTWHMVFTALDDEANAMEEEAIRTKLDLGMTFLAETLKHYCETGEMLK